MKIKNQFITSMVVFSAVLIIITASFISTNQQVEQLNNQVVIAQGIERGASELSYLSNDYFLYQESQQLDRWESKFSSLSSDLASLNPTSPEQQTFVSNIETDLQRLHSVFTGIVAFLENAPRNVSVRIDPAFQISWSRMAVQNQGLAFDAAQLSQITHTQADQAQQVNLITIFTLLGIFGAYFLTNYLLVYRRTLKSISDLQSGIRIIGSGNLDHSVKAKKDDEIGELASSFNQMTANLKTVTASKTELEKEIEERKKAEEQLLVSEKRYRRLYETSQDGIIARDTQGGLIDCNQAYTKMIGYSKEELRKLTVQEILPEKWHEQREKIAKEVMETGGSFVFEREYRRKDGSVFPASVRTWRLTDEQGKTVGVWSIVRDITQRKRIEDELRETRNYLENLLSHANAPIIVWDPEFRITMFNRAFEHLTGLQQNEVIGKELGILFPENEKEEALSYIKRTLEGESWDSVEIPILHKNGNVRVALWNSANILDSTGGNIVATIAQGQDITERKRLQEELEDNAAQLKEYAARMEELAEERAKKLKDAERLAAIGQTAGMVGHDIRNPLQSITGDLYLAKQDLTSLPQSEEKEGIKESLEAIENSVDYINKIVADLQDFAKPLNPHTEKTDLKLTINDLITKNGVPDNVKTRVKIAKEAQTVTADSAYIKRILGNLISNAVQAMPNGGTLAISVTTENNDSVITVEDSGTGIPEEVKTKLFQPLFTTKSKGQGFGLAVVKRMTEALDGTVTFESQTNKGTKFIIKLPQKPPKTQKRPKQNGQ